MPAKKEERIRDMNKLVKRVTEVRRKYRKIKYHENYGIYRENAWAVVGLFPPVLADAENRFQFMPSHEGEGKQRDDTLGRV